MRIVDVCAFYTPHGGGVRTYVERKLRAARANGAEMIIVAPGERDATTLHTADGRVETIAAPLFPADRRYRYFDDEPALHGLLDRLAPDVVEASSPWTSASMVARWRGSAVRSLVMHADPLSAYAYRWFGGIASRETIDRGFEWFWRHLRRLDAAADVVVSASADLSRRLTAGGLHRVATLPMGVEPKVFSPDHRDPALRAELLAGCGLAEDATLLIGLGRMAPEKRWPMVIDAVTAAGNRHRVGLVLFGDGRDRRRVVRAAGENPHIRVHAPIADRSLLARVLASGDALVHGCEAETFCMVAAEARASGLPLLVPDWGGAADHHRPGAGDRYVARSAPSLAKAIGQIATDKGAMRRAAVAGCDVRTMDDHLSELFDLYRDLASRRTTARAA